MVNKREKIRKDWWNNKIDRWENSVGNRWEILDGVYADDHDRVPNIIEALAKCRWEELPEGVKKIIRPYVYGDYLSYKEMEKDEI